MFSDGKESISFVELSDSVSMSLALVGCDVCGGRIGSRPSMVQRRTAVLPKVAHAAGLI